MAKLSKDKEYDETIHMKHINMPKSIKILFKQNFIKNIKKAINISPLQQKFIRIIINLNIPNYYFFLSKTNNNFIIDQYLFKYFTVNTIPVIQFILIQIFTFKKHLFKQVLNISIKLHHSNYTTTSWKERIQHL